jgi:hemerythrin-like domain-containing protein
MTLRQFLNHAEQFIHYLEVHHSIEEQVLYPQLAHKLSHFDPKNGALVGQHKEIHEGMDGLDKYIKDCKAGRADFSLAGLKEKMETWGDILWTHLDEEVEALGAAHIHKAFTREELMRIRM